MSNTKYLIGLTTVIVLLAAAAYSDDMYCREDTIKQCIQPTYDALKAYAPAADGKHFLLTSFENYRHLLTGGEHPNEIHMSSLDTIVLPLDQMLLDTTGHDALCSEWNTTLHCLKPHLLTCDNEVRDALRGLMDVFADVCSPFAAKVLSRESACVLRSNVTRTVTERCTRVLNQTLERVPFMQDCEADAYGPDGVNGTDTSRCEELAKSYAETLLRDGAVIPIDDSESHSVIAAQVCNGVDATLRCYKDEMTAKCGSWAAEKEYQIRHELVHWLLVDLNCEGIDGSFCNISEFACSNGTCISGVYRCDGVDHCSDGGDERYCGASGSMSVATIVLIVVIVVVVVIIAVACVIKTRQERHERERYGRYDDADEEMQNVLQQREQSMGRSTPPTGGDKAANGDDVGVDYTFKAIRT